jgi:uncharacterized protein (TIGR02145 family)/prepilin-type N-terminal cleavage/methylation domain-containing protein
MKEKETEKEKEKKQKHKGFTLIELIVVAGIIALISTFAIISVSKARVAVRDAKRTDSVRTTVLALEQYYSKHNSYPTELISGAELIDNDGIVYMSSIPSNPTPRTDGDCPEADFNYETFNNGQNYMLTFCLSSKTGSLNPGVSYYQNSSLISCGMPITDRDGYTYNTTNVGGQCWMAENLKTKTKPDGTHLTNLEDNSERDCMSSTWDERGVEADCDAGRVLYTIEAATNGSMDEKAQGLCPDGWHLPTDSEWHTLEAYLSDSGSGPACDPERLNSAACSGAGTKLLTNGSSNMNISFTGMRYYDSGERIYMFIGWNSFAKYWSSTHTENTTYIRGLDDSNTLLVSRDTSDAMSESLPVRCIKNL